MRIGIDFDNTIVCYDGMFHDIARERALIPSELPPSKNAVRDYLRGGGREDAWVELQGFVYGPGLARAEAYPGVWDFLSTCAANDVTVNIISHKTQRPAAGPAYDLHESARGWLRAQIARRGLSMDAEASVYLEETRAEKLARIRTLACDWFIDDLPELLSEPEFPTNVGRILFDPSGSLHLPPGVQRTASWHEITARFFGPKREVLARE
jgi:hypothetical protein